MSAWDKLNAYFEAAFVRHTHDYNAAIMIQRLTKWWLEFARNILVVGGLYYLAEKSDSTALKIFSYINLAALFAYMTSHFNNWSFRLFPYIQKRALYNIVNLGIWLVFALGLSFGSIY